VAAELGALTVLESGERQFKNDLQAFVEGLDGEVLPTSGETLVSDIFERYFAVQPPFEVVEDKKFEFPDAAALLVLERYAKDQTEIGVLISNDRGWHSFANKSEHLFCVKTLENFTALFAALSDHAKQLQAKFQESLNAPTSQCSVLLEDAISSHVADAEWSVDEIYSGNAHRLEGEAFDARVVEFNPDFQSMKGWFTDEDSPLYVVELPVSINVEVSVSVAFYQWDSIDREEIHMGSQEVSVPMDIDVSVFLTSSGELMASPVDDWVIEVEIAAGRYSVDVGEVNLDYADDEDRDPYQD
jgi:predicted transcriptional regulator